MKRTHGLMKFLRYGPTHIKNTQKKNQMTPGIRKDPLTFSLFAAHPYRSHKADRTWNNLTCFLYLINGIIAYTFLSGLARVFAQHVFMKVICIFECRVDLNFYCIHSIPYYNRHSFLCQIFFLFLFFWPWLTCFCVRFWSLFCNLKRGFFSVILASHSVLRFWSFADGELQGEFMDFLQILVNETNKNEVVDQGSLA